MISPLPRPSELLLQELVAVSRDGMLAFDRQFRYLLWNRSMERMVGLKSEQVLGKCAFDIFPYLIETGEDECLKRALAGERVVSRNRPFHIESNQRRGFYEAEYSPLKDADGEIMGGLAIVRDATAAMLVDQELREAEERFRTMADVAPVLLWMARTDGMCTFFNQTWLSFTGRTLEEEWGVGWAEGVHFEDFQRCVDTYMAAFNQRETFEMEYRLRRHDGEYRWILDRGTPRYTPDGTFAGYIGSCVDITQQKELEMELREAVHTRDEFLAVASHELRTPIAALQLKVDSMLRSLQKQSHEHQSRRLEKYVLATREHIAQLSEMVNSLLDTSRLADGQIVLDYEWIDLALLTQQVVQRFKDTALQARCDVQLKIQSVPKGMWDRQRVEQVLTNLLSNAVKYGAGKPVEVVLEQIEDQVKITVSDHGIGISRESQRLLFERFARMVSPPEHKGLGLGLWICREIVEAHHGHIAVQSELGVGATFKVELPKLPAGGMFGASYPAIGNGQG